MTTDTKGPEQDASVNSTETVSQQPPAPQAEQDNWRQRFAGLQGKYQQLHEENLSLKGKTMDIQSAYEKLTGELEAIRVEKETTGKKYVEVEAALGTLKAENERLSILVDEFPELLPFHKDGLLPPGQGDELRKKLTAFKSKLSTMQTAPKKPEPGTNTPPPPPGDTESGKDTLLNQAIAAMRNGNQAEYDRLMTEYIRSKNQK